MLFIRGDIEMRILSKRQLKELVLYSPNTSPDWRRQANSRNGYSSVRTV